MKSKRNRKKRFMPKPGEDPGAYERANKAYRQSLGRPPGMAFNPNHIANPPDSDMP